MNTKAAGELYIGLISGTSVDGIDAGLFEFSPQKGQTACRQIETLQFDYPEKVRKEILALSQPGENEIERLGIADHQLGQLFADAALALIKKAKLSISNITAIGSHGQTIRHRANIDAPFTLQIGDANRIAHKTGITTVADLRRKDMAAGGQGAPLAPAFHQAVFGEKNKKRCVINIGGMTNISVLAENPDNVIGYDTGPGNVLMDSWAQALLNEPYDANGDWAASGNSNESLLKIFLEHPYLTLPFPKSTGREEFNRFWLMKALAGRAMHPDDVQATLCEFTACTIADAVEQHHCDEVYLSGGGVRNRTLMTALKEKLSNKTLGTTEQLGIHPDWVEAGLCAWLAKQRLNNVPVQIAKVTGASEATTLGAVYLP
ncbi:MAG: anhydro-N-acetylmuramic acid kinase [Agarilytica sp.]